ncbi:MAG: hypothetical protein ACOC44_16660 [Promethearchaeia archaeon]
MDSSERTSKLSIREQVVYTLIFLFGMVFSYAFFMPIGIICGSFLLFQKKSKAFQIMGLIMFILQILVIYIFADMVIEAAQIDALFRG